MEDEIKEIFNIEELFDEWKRFLSWCYENNDKTVEIHRDKLKWTMDYITNLQEENQEKDKEIDRLNNIIDELEKWLEEQSKLDHGTYDRFGETLDKLKELKEMNK